MGLRSLALLALLATCSAITCLDESGEPVSWWFIYKLPDGLRYAYRDVRTASAGTPFEPASGTLDCGTSCALGATLSQVYEDKENLAYVLYNDEEAGDDVGLLNATETGHTKGVIAMNATRGFWLVHSVPKFPLLTLPSYQWQASTTYGQSFLCITMRPGDINGVSTQMQITYPIIYGSNLPESVPESLVPEFYNLARGTHLSGSRAYPWVSADGITFTSFTKAPQWGADLYENLVIPGLKVSAGFMWETWRRSPYLPTYCAGVDGEVYTSSNINDIALGSDPANAFKYTNDHSKWGVSLDNSQPYVCVGDINRMPSQRVRGGGTVCFQHNGLWRSLTAAVSNADHCS